MPSAGAPGLHLFSGGGGERQATESLAQLLFVEQNFARLSLPSSCLPAPSCSQKL